MTAWVPVYVTLEDLPEFVIARAFAKHHPIATWPLPPYWLRERYQDQHSVVSEDK